jgi:23S rRNA (guanosine2251-2'-O)-methyltransferase
MAIKFKGRKGGRDTPQGKSPQQRSAPGIRRNAPGGGDERPPKRPFPPRQASPERPPKPSRDGGRQAERPGRDDGRPGDRQQREPERPAYRAEQPGRPPLRQAKRPGRDAGRPGDRQRREPERPTYRADQPGRPPLRTAGRQVERPDRDDGRPSERPRREPERPTYRAEQSNRPPLRPAGRQAERPADRQKRRPAVPPEPVRAAATPTPPPRIRPATPPRDGGLWLYGRHAVAAALANPERRIRRFLAAAEMEDDAQALIVAAGARLPPGPQPEILPRAAFEALVPAGAVHQGMALSVEPLPELAIEDVIDRVGPPPAAGTITQIVVLLDQVTDPHNVGAVLRSAAAFGVLALVLPEHGAPPVTGVLAKAASGALEHVPILRVVNLVRAIDRLKSAGFWCVGLDETAERPLAALKLEGRIALVLGGEGEGMRRLTRERCDLVARLPTVGAIASLNVSNAAAIALYELVRGDPTRS